jgi:hypothetical protein
MILNAISSHLPIGLTEADSFSEQKVTGMGQAQLPFSDLVRRRVMHQHVVTEVDLRAAASSKTHFESYVEQDVAISVSGIDKGYWNGEGVIPVADEIPQRSIPMPQMA